MGLDWVQHYLWDTKLDGTDAVDSFYELIDDTVGRLVEALDDDWAVVLLSDHGARGICGEIHVNDLLEDRGYLHQPAEDPTLYDAARNALLTRIHRVGRTLPTSVSRVVVGGLPSGMVDRVENAAGVVSDQAELSDAIDWNRTEAFSYGYMGRVFVHDDQRYAEGVVSCDDYEAVREELAAELRSLKHPETGDSLVDAVHRGEDVYVGDHVAEAPDLLVVPTDWRYTIYGDFGGEWFANPKLRVADHDPEGVLVWSGPGTTDWNGAADLEDVAPTLLARHGLPVLDGMDGAVRSEFFKESICPVVERVPLVAYDGIERTFTDGPADEVVRERLEDLGYM